MKLPKRLVLALWLCASVAQAQSLGELAKKEKARRKELAGRPPAKKLVLFGGALSPPAVGGSPEPIRDGGGAPSHAGTRAPSPDPGNAPPSLPPADAPRTEASSTMDREWTRAQAFEPRARDLSRRLRALGESERRYEESCREKYTVQTTEPSDPSLPPPVWVEANETTAACRMLRSDIEVERSSLREDRDALREDARREQILPGFLRALERQWGIDGIP